MRGRTGGIGGRGGIVVLLACIATSTATAQTLTQRGFVEGSTLLFPQQAPNDPTRAVGDLLAREDVFFKPAPWIQFAGGIDLRANSHGQVDDRWSLDLDDRGPRRPRASLRRLAATLTRGPVTVDLGKQFIRWGKADVVNPTDRFAPRDFVNLVDTEFLAVTGARAVVQHRSETFEGVWLPRFTPSRVPLFDQRWTVLPAEAAQVAIVDAGPELPGGPQVGLRWGHVGGGFEYSLSFFDGFNYLPNISAAAVSNAEIQSPHTATALPVLRYFDAGTPRFALTAPMRRCRPRGSRSRPRPRTSPRARR